MSSDDDRFIDNILDENEGRKRPKTQTQTKKEMSDNPKETIKGEPVVSVEGSQEIDQVKAMKREWGKLRQRTPGLQKYKFDEVHVKEGKIVVDEEKYKERIAHEEELMKKDAEVSASARTEGHLIRNPLPKFDRETGFKAYNKEKWDKDGELEIV